MLRGVWIGTLGSTWAAWKVKEDQGKGPETVADRLFHEMGPTKGALLCGKGQRSPSL